jgi:early secretory antigenic target protein ESAT-6
MTRYQVDSEAVLSATATVQGSIGRIQAEVAGLHGQLVDLQGSWSGSAAPAVHAGVGVWKGTQQRVEEALASINQALSAAARQYAEVEEGNARMFAH